MGLIKAFTSSAMSYISDLWEDYIYCDSLDGNILVMKGRARKSAGAGGNANENVITDGSRIAVNAGQLLILVENGRIIDFTAEQGGYEYKSGTSPTMFCGDFGEALKISFEQMSARFAFGGMAGNDQRAYFVNTKEIPNNRFGFGNVPYRDGEFNMTILLQGFGVFSYEITDPITFYTNVCGNVADKYMKSSIEPQLKAELQSAVLPVLGELAESGVHYDRLSGQTERITELLQSRLEEHWKKDRGIEIKTVAFGNILPDDESVDKIRQLQESRAYSGNTAMLGARVGAAQASAMESAAENSAGAVTGFMGMNMAQNAGGVNVGELMRMQTAQPPQQTQSAVRQPAPSGDVWVCGKCGMENTMRFCPGCGSKRPETAVCGSCGFEIPAQFAEMKFCPNCGKER
ncbi:MAG: SPFH domain-containing protein [Prevotella sp.]|nr:SPFH domain-containing protein [Prevotella sp.]